MTLPDSLAETAPSELGFPDDPYDVRLALRSSGLLRAFNDAAVITAADVHVAQRLAELGGESNQSVLLAIALAVRGVRSGSVCVDLEQLRGQLWLVDPALPWPEPRSWLPAVAASPLVGEGRPLRFEYGLLYLDRYRRQEEQVRQDLLVREALPPPVVQEPALTAGLDRLFPGTEAGQQRRAAEIAARQWTTVLGGGPGTGKTTTVARILALLLDQSTSSLRVAMAAPTGKAAARLQAAVQTEAGTFALADRHQLTTLTASTLHRLLGWVPGGGTRFRHNRDNRLPFDVVVVDDTLMVSLTMMARLLEAVRPDARLILVGDPDQLASVEAGAVLADLVAGLTARAALASSAGRKTGAKAAAKDPVQTTAEDSMQITAGDSVQTTVKNAGQSTAKNGQTTAKNAVQATANAAGRATAAVQAGPAGDGGGVVLLRKTWRFGGAIAELAAAVRDGDAEAALAVLHEQAGGPVALVAHDDPGIRADVVGAASQVRESARGGDGEAALARLELHRLLCAHRTGERGVQDWTRRIENWLADEHDDFGEGEWYAGRPVLVMANDYALGLFNGDTGVVVRDQDAALRAVFRREGKLASYAPRRLADVQTVHAMTVHRSQGSQFQRVTFVLPEHDSPLSTRELLYTALTRAESFVRLVGTESELRAAISRPAARASGLRLRLVEQ